METSQIQYSVDMQYYICFFCKVNWLTLQKKPPLILSQVVTPLKTSSRFSFSAVKKWESKEIHHAKSHIHVQCNASLSSQKTVSKKWAKNIIYIQVSPWIISFSHISVANIQHYEAILKPKLLYLPSLK